jgi:PEP-CTERM motif
MKLRIAPFAILGLALALPAWAGADNNCLLPGCGGGGYENGYINGTTDAWTINFGYIVSNTFTGVANVMSFEIAVWEFPGDMMTSVDWSITTQENGGGTLGQGTASGNNVRDRFLSTNQYGYDIDVVSVSGLNVNLNSNTTYWLNLQNASVPSGDPVFWDENSGVGCKSPGCPSKASESAIGTIPSEAFAINESLQPPVPEPSSFLLFGSGVLGLAGVLRGKRRL